MKYIELQTAFELEIDQLDNNLTKPTTSDIEYWLMAGLDKFIKTRYSGINFKQTGFEQDQKRIDDLRTLVTRKSYQFNTYPEEYTVTLPDDYMFTVGETAGVTIEQAKKYANLDGSELNMVFQFEHMGTTDGKYGKWTTRKPEMKKVRAVMNKWQTKLEGKAWNSLSWDNHDQPRAVSRFGDDSPMYREISAKMIATCLHMLKGSPYIYQGEEIGMTNAYFKSISDYRDIESINAYKEYTESGLMTEEEMLNFLKMISRDNARTPMQWDDSANAGFTTGTPWISVNKNYTQINAKAALEDKDSVFYYYQKLIRLRHQYEVIVEGVFHGLLEDNDDIYAYERTLGNEKLVVACNFTNKEVPCELFEENKGEELITNYKNHVEGILQPYETRVILYK